MAKSVKSSTKLLPVHTWRDNPPATGEDFSERVSLAVPNQSMTVQEIVEKFTRGQVDFPERDMIFLGEAEVPNFEFMSRIDQLVVAGELRRVIAQRKAVLEELESKQDEDGNPIVVPESQYKDLTEQYEPPEVDPD